MDEQIYASFRKKNSIIKQRETKTRPKPEFNAPNETTSEKENQITTLHGSIRETANEPDFIMRPNDGFYNRDQLIKTNPAPNTPKLRERFKDCVKNGFCRKKSSPPAKPLPPLPSAKHNYTNIYNTNKFTNSPPLPMQMS